MSRQCLSKWVNRYRACGEAGLADRSCAPRSCPTQTPPQVVELIEGWRRQHKWSARQIAVELAAHGHQVSVATVGRWLVRLGINRRRDLDPGGANNRRPGKITARYPGHMVHLDVKKVGRIPDGGGWRAHGRDSERTRPRRRAGPRAGRRPGRLRLPALGRRRVLPARLHRAPARRERQRPRSRLLRTAPGPSSPPTASPHHPRRHRQRSCYRAAPSPAPPRTRPGTNASSPTRPSTTARSSATSAPSPKNSSTPASGPEKPNAPTPSRSGTSTTTTIDHTPPPATSPPPHAYPNRHQPHDPEHLEETAGIRQTLRDELVEIYREQRVEAEQIAWLVRHLVYTVQRQLGNRHPDRIRSRAANTGSDQTPLRYWAGCGHRRGVWVAGAAVLTTPLRGIALVALALVAAVSGVWPGFALRPNDGKCKRQGGTGSPAHGPQASVRPLVTKLSDRPTDKEMASWLECDRKIQVDKALRHTDSNHAMCLHTPSSRRRASGTSERVSSTGRGATRGIGSCSSC